MKVLPSITFAWRTNREGNDPWRPATKKIEFPWPSILGGICLAAGRQGSFPWRVFLFSLAVFDRQGNSVLV